jgi:hypothetical protein
MAFARVVTFEGVEQERMDELNRRISDGEKPPELPATEMIVLYDKEGEKSTVIVFFDSEEDYRRGDEFLSSMPADDTPGRRTSVGKYEVAVRATP